ncbi:MAG: hypothetical protein JWM68_1804 [Verrucomicrobiales bacterium]|nr:hypothetical protein [Verrucomicrobiales bacterium]
MNADLSELTRGSVPAQSDVRVQQPVESFRFLRKIAQGRLLQRLGEAVEHRPHRPLLELFVARLPPFLEHRGDEAVGADADIAGPDDEIMHLEIVDFGFLVGGDAAILVIPEITQLADGALHDLRQVPIDERGVLAGELHLAAEGEVVADEHVCPSNDASRERFVVRVAEPKYERVVIAGNAPVPDLHEAEVAHSIMTEAVRKRPDAQARCIEGRVNPLN